MFATQPLSQRNELWKDFKLGNGDCTIGSDGCLLTCFTMLCQSLDVEAMNNYRIAKGGFAGAYASTFDLLRATDKLVYTPTPQTRYVRTPYPDTEKLHSHLEEGNPAILEVNWYHRFRPAIWRIAYGMHFVLLMPNGQVFDPWPTPNEYKSVCDLFEYGKSPEEAITRAIYYEVTK